MRFSTVAGGVSHLLHPRAICFHSADSELTQLETQLGRALGRCIAEHNLVEHGDRIMVAMSGGKDSYTMLHLLMKLVPRLPFKVELIAVHLDQAQPNYDGTASAAISRRTGCRYEILREDTYSVVDRPYRRQVDVLLAVLALAPRHPLHGGGARSAVTSSRSVIIAMTRSRR